MKKSLLIIAMVAAGLASGCYYDNYEKLHPVVVNPTPTVCDTTGIKFSTTITTIFNANCINGCHSSSTMAGSVVLDTYVGAHKQVNNGQLLPAINHSQPNGTGNIFWMPLTGSLTTCDISKIQQWVNAGAPNN
ncbi:MAG TPA: hypothetical protein VNZ86_08255 [Bacteroidia bacterium]|jgi:hypothetical protein|nr:hypothetical protein [Bacteroidia bacterium]